MLVCFHENRAKEALAMVRPDGSFPNELINGQYISTIEMFDLFEAELNRGFERPDRPTLVDIDPQESLIQYTGKIEQRFQDYASDVGRTIQLGKKLIPENNIRFYNGAVAQNKDIGTPGFIQSDLCAITTMAIQRSYYDFYELYIDARLFNHPAHKRLSKAILLLHEYVYATARQKRSVQDSLTTRKLVEMIITRDKTVSVNYFTNMFYNLDFAFNGTIPSVDRGHIFLSNMIKNPALMFTLLSSDLASQIKSYKPHNFQVWVNSSIEALRPIFDANEVFREQATLHEIVEWASVYRKDHVVYHEFIKQLEVYLREMGPALHLENQAKLNKFLASIDQAPGSEHDKNIMKDILIKNYSEWHLMAIIYNSNSPYPAVNMFLNQRYDFKSIMSEWSRLSYNNGIQELELLHTIP